MNILIIGGGNMGTTYAQSFLRSHVTSLEGMRILEKNAEKAALLTTKNIGSVGSDPALLLPSSDLIVLAVKPQDTKALFASLQPYVNDQQVFVSIMAGVTIQSIQEALGITKVVRAMPNLPAQVGKGMTVYTSSEQVTRLELVMVQNLLATTGKNIYVAREEMLDAATAISGSGPAYVFYFMRAMMSRAESLGFTKSEAELLVLQTFSGGVNLYEANDLDCEEWIQRVSSRGGTTEAAMKSFSESEVQKAIENGLQAAFDRAVELGKT
ncbi:MAG: pyrroline-5-carboxylate reductase [Saprospiraceae bacterium]